jgi:L-asparaginase II
MNRDVVELVRGSIVESSHRIHVAVVDSGGRLRASVGDPDRITYFRSAAKPLQALPIVEDGAYERFGLTPEELAICCGSHSGEPRHLAAVQSILRKVGVDGEALACGPHPPFHAPSRRELTESGLEPVRLHNNCSGKHAGMIALARVHGWDPAGYQRLEHSVQGRVFAELTRWVGVPYDGIGLALDGCGVVSFALPIRNMALGFARLAAAARRGDAAPALVVNSMTGYPAMVAGEGRICSDLIARMEGRIVAKVGAEGIYGVAVPGAELGIALKVEDGSKRAVSSAILAVLRQLDLISEDDLGALHSYAYPDVFNTCGEIVGQLRPQICLSSPSA